MEGNIGAGKTTLIEYFCRKHPAQIYGSLEPVAKWRDVRGHNLLALMYSDPKKWSLAFQQYVQLTMVKVHQEQAPETSSGDSSGARVKLMERSIYSARHCFVENLARKELMDPAEFAVYDEWFKWLTSQNSTAVDLIVYLRSDPLKCYERIMRRGRCEESGVSLVSCTQHFYGHSLMRTCINFSQSYLEDLHSLHEDWLGKESDLLPAPVLTLSSEVTENEMLNTFHEIAPYILGASKLPKAGKISKISASI